MKNQILNLLQEKRNILEKYLGTKSKHFDRLVRDELDDVEYSNRVINDQCSERFLSKLKREIDGEMIVHKIAWIEFEQWIKSHEILKKVDIAYDESSGGFQSYYSVDGSVRAFGIKRLCKETTYNCIELVDLVTTLLELERLTAEYNVELLSEMKRLPPTEKTWALCSWTEVDRYGNSVKRRSEKIPDFVSVMEDFRVKGIELTIIYKGRTMLLYTKGYVNKDNFVKKLLDSMDSYYGNAMHREWLSGFVKGMGVEK